MRPRRIVGATDKVEQQMTPMIDMVFQLLTFFIMTFKVASVEGNFDIKMPQAAPSQSDDTPPPPIKVRLTANGNGTLNQIQMGDKSLGTNFSLLNREIRAFAIPGQSGVLGDLEVEIDADYNLHYGNVIDTITAVSGYINGEGKPVTLIEKVKFSQPRKPR